MHVVNVYLRCAVLALAALPVFASATDPAPSPTTNVAAPVHTSLNSTKLGKIQVKGLMPMVEVLQQMKVAIDAPFSDDPKHYDDMVCRFADNEGFRAQGKLLDCGTQGWFGMRRGAYHQNMGMDPDTSATPNLGHPWHIVRMLDQEQLAALRAVLAKLPEPGKGGVKIIGDDTAPSAH